MISEIIFGISGIVVAAIGGALVYYLVFKTRSKNKDE